MSQAIIRYHLDILIYTTQHTHTFRKVFVFVSQKQIQMKQIKIERKLSVEFFRFFLRLNKNHNKLQPNNNYFRFTVKLSRLFGVVPPFRIRNENNDARNRCLTAHLNVSLMAPSK